jgi:periplasmic protein CpxP/Spy
MKSSRLQSLFGGRVRTANCHLENKERKKESMKPEVAKIVESELKQFASELNLSDSQKTQLKTALENARTKLDELADKHPDLTKPDASSKISELRSSLRERVVKFLTPEQLTKWDAKMAKVKSFMGHNIKA